MIETEDIHQTITFETTPEELYEILLDSKRLSEAAGGAHVTMEKKVGGEFKVQGWWYGIHLELVPGKRVVQAWRWNNKDFGSWPEGHFSIVSYELTSVKDGTKLTFDHIGVPHKVFESISDGWKQFHWNPIKELLAKKK